MIYLEDKIFRPRGNLNKKDVLYRATCDKCQKDKGYVPKCKAHQLCRSCAMKSAHKQISKDTRLKMSQAKKGKTPWNKGTNASLESRLKMSAAKRGCIPWNKGTGTTKQNIKSKYRHLLRKAVHKQIVEKDFMIFLGCNAVTLRKHIESLFITGMSWDNYGRGGWHLDHVIPLRHFDLTNDNELVIACNYKNVQPLFSKKNLSKHRRVVYLLTGAPGAGKSWVCSKLKKPLEPIDLDIVRPSKLNDTLKATYRPVIAMTIGVSTFIKNNPDFDIRLVVIKESEDIIRKRIKQRNGVFTDTIMRRMRRMESLAKKAVFSGNSSECLNYLSNFIEF